MKDEYLRREATDPERDARLGRLLAEEYGANESALAGRAQSIIAAVARQSEEARYWWTSIARWSRALLPLGMATAVAVFCLLLRTPVTTLTPNTVPYPGSLGAATVVGIIATRATSQDVVSVLMPATADELLTAAVRQ